MKGIAFPFSLSRRRFRSIGLRLASTYAVSTIVTITLLFAIGHRLLEARLIAGLDLLNRSEFQQIQNHLGDDYPDLTPAVVERRIRETTEDASVLFFINIQGNPERGLFRSSNLKGANIPDVPGEQKFNVFMPGIGELRVGEFVLQPFDVEIATPLSEVRDLMRGYAEVSLGLIGLLVLVSILIGLSLSRLILQPLRAIQGTALRIGSDTLGERIPVSDVEDELSDLARLLNQMFDRLEHAFSQMRRFAGEASHELKTSLSLIRLHTEKLVVIEDLTAPQQDIVHDQLEELTRLNQILDGLLFLSRAEANAVALNAAPQDVAAFLAAFQVDAHALCEYRGCRLSCVQLGRGEVVFDPALIRRVLLNLLSNALNVSPKDGQITLHSQLDQAVWRVVVEDEGPGLSPGQQERVFERFVRLSPHSPQDGGSGLGLPICRSIILLHRGRIFLESRPASQGLRAVFEVPAAQFRFVSESSARTLRTRKIEGEFMAAKALTAALLANSALFGVAGAQALPPATHVDQKHKLTSDLTMKSQNPEKRAEEVVVTGSRLKLRPDQAVAAVTRIGAAQIAQSGVSSNTQDILRKEVPALEGRGNTGTGNANNLNQNTAGGAVAQLHNLDTLVLVDGRRMAVSGIAGIGGKSFVDLNEIAPSAIERVEVLTDGASSIYGSDAIGGVVNIILKKHVTGTEFNTRWGFADNGYLEKSGSLTTGFSWNNLDVTFSGSILSTAPLYQRDRSFSQPIIGKSSTLPGSIGGSSPALLAPGLVSPSQLLPTGLGATATSLGQLEGLGVYLPTTTAGLANKFDFSRYQTLLLGTQQKNLYLSAENKLFDGAVTLYGDVLYSDNISTTNFLPYSTSVTAPAGSPYDPITSSVAGVNFGDLNLPKSFNNDQESARVTIGMRGTFSHDGTWDIGFVHSENWLSQMIDNVIFAPNLKRAINGGYNAAGQPTPGGGYSLEYDNFSIYDPLVITPALNPFARANGLSAASLAHLYGTEMIHASSRLDSVDGSLTGNVFRLPAGNIGVAVGFQLRQEALSASTDAAGTNTGPTKQEWMGGVFADPFAASRNVGAIFGEVRVPIFSPSYNLPGFHAFDLIAAGRGENYSDAGRSFVPKIGARWQPSDRDLTIRTSYSRSFTAPTLYAESGPTDTRLVGSSVISSVFGLPNPGLQGEDGNNPQLHPSISHTFNINATYTPSYIPGLTLSAEYAFVRQEGFPGGVGFTNILQSVNQLGAASPFANQIALNNFPGLPGATPFTAPGQLLAYLKANPNNALNVYAVDRFRNLGGIHARIFTLTGGYDMPLNDGSTLSFNSAGTIFDSFKFQALPGQKYYQYAGYTTNGGTGVQGTLPTARFYSTLSWTHENWSVMAGNTFVSSVTDIGAGGVVFDTSKILKPIQIPAYVSWDLRATMNGALLFGRRWKPWTLSAGINNITNAMPPLAPQAFPDNNADVSTYSPIGRLFYFGVTGAF